MNCPVCGPDGRYSWTQVVGLARESKRRTYWACCKMLREYYIYSSDEQIYLAHCEEVRKRGF